MKKESSKQREYEAARKRYLARGSFPLNGAPQTYPAREALYDREIFKR